MSMVMSTEMLDPIYPDQMPLWFAVPAIIVLMAIYFVLGSKERREKRARKARLRK